MKLLTLAFAVLCSTASPIQDTKVLTTPSSGSDRAFDAATIRPSEGAADGPGTFRLNGRTFIAINSSLRDLIKFAYGLHASQIVNAPAWVATNRYDIEGVPEGEGLPNELEWKRMLRKLVADRFRLTFQRGQRDLPAFVIMRGNGQPKLTPTKSDPSSLPRAPFRLDGTRASTRQSRTLRMRCRASPWIVRSSITPILRDASTSRWNGPRTCRNSAAAT